MDLNPRILKIDGDEALVVMTMADYRRLREVLEDAEDVLALRAARRADRGKRDYSIEEVRERLGLNKRRGAARKRPVRRKAG